MILMFLLLLGALLPGCLHKPNPETRRNKAIEHYHHLKYMYQQELHILEQDLPQRALKQAIKDEVLMQHEGYLAQQRTWFTRLFQPELAYRCYPYRRYKKQLEEHIHQVEHYLTPPICLYPPISNDMRALLYQLQDLHRIIITLDPYQAECTLYEQEKQQQTLQRLLDKQNTYLREQNELLRQQQEAQHAPKDEQNGTPLRSAVNEHARHKPKS